MPKLIIAGKEKEEVEVPLTLSLEPSGRGNVCLRARRGKDASYGVLSITPDGKVHLHSSVHESTGLALDSIGRVIIDNR